MRRSSLWLAVVIAAGCAGPAPKTAAPATPDLDAALPASSASAASSASPPPNAVASASARPAPSILSPGMVLVGDIIGPPAFDAKAPVVKLKPQLLRCYNDARLLNLEIHGKLTLRLQVSESGLVTLVSSVPTPQPGPKADDPGLVACLGDALKAATFPRPGGTAIITVPLVFRP